MPCFSPLKGYKLPTPNPATGKHSIKILGAAKRFTQKGDRYFDYVEIPCGQCIGCKLKKSKEWAIRIMLEASLYDHNSFITLTYDNNHLPPNGSINKQDPVDFMKRLREFYGSGIRSYGCAEYGENFGRPHYHICLFNHHFPDAKQWTTRRGFPVYRSEKLEQLWPLGISEIGTLTFQSAAYVARYIMKKFTGPESESHYEVPDMETGELTPIEPERPICISRGGDPLKGGGGIGRPWLEKFKTDVFPKDFITINGQKMHPPKYFDYRLEIDNPEEYAIIKAQRRRNLDEALAREPDQRLDVKEFCMKQKLNLLKRNLENEPERHSQPKTRTK
uniref:Replication protein VP4 n=1 Tax=Gokushovirinae environmental samples TaxID=1478972 RepID=A0A2R3UAE7_9VIRU|nr:replication protein VP4 [Gokushovirinae environmental samples]